MDSTAYLIKRVDLYAPAQQGTVDILMIGGLFAAIGRELSVELPGLTVIDGSGKKAIPGLIDQHVHIIGGGGEGGFDTRTPEIQLSDIVRAGVTTLVGLLGTDSFTRDIESLVSKTKALKRGGISAYCLTGAYQYPPITLTGSVTKDITYIEEIIGSKLAISDHRCSHPTVAEIIRLASDIRMAALIAGKAGVLHIHVGSGKRGIRDLFAILDETNLPAWHFRPTHMEGHPTEAIAWTKRGGYADSTAEPEQAESFWQMARQAEKGFLTLSSDAGGSIPKWNDRKEIIGIGVGKMDTLLETVLTLHRRLGVPLAEALPFVTDSVGKALRLFPKKGAVMPGSDADLVLLDEQYLIDAVFAMGRPMMLDKKVLVKGIFED